MDSCSDKEEITDAIEHVGSDSSDCESVSMSPETIATVVGTSLKKYFEYVTFILYVCHI